MVPAVNMRKRNCKNMIYNFLIDKCRLFNYETNTLLPTFEQKYLQYPCSIMIKDSRTKYVQQITMCMHTNGVGVFQFYEKEHKTKQTINL